VLDALVDGPAQKPLLTDCVDKVPAEQGLEILLSERAILIQRMARIFNLSGGTSNIVVGHGS